MIGTVSVSVFRAFRKGVVRFRLGSADPVIHGNHARLRRGTLAAAAAAARLGFDHWPDGGGGGGGGGGGMNPAS